MLVCCRPERADPLRAQLQQGLGRSTTNPPRTVSHRTLENGYSHLGLKVGGRAGCLHPHELRVVIEGDHDGIACLRRGDAQPSERTECGCTDLAIAVRDPGHGLVGELAKPMPADDVEGGPDEWRGKATVEEERGQDDGTPIARWASARSKTGHRTSDRSMSPAAAVVAAPWGRSTRDTQGCRLSAATGPAP